MQDITIKLSHEDLVSETNIDNVQSKKESKNNESKSKPHIQVIYLIFLQEGETKIRTCLKWEN